MEYVILIFWFLLVAGAVAVIIKFFSKRKTVLWFQNYGKVDIPYVVIDIQGIPFNMIVDTGCGVSIISSETLQMLDFKESQRKISLSAITDDAIKSGVVTVPIEISGKTMDEDFAIYPKTNIGNFNVMYGITIHGILGNEFLDRRNAKIDYSKHAIII